MRRALGRAATFLMGAVLAAACTDADPAGLDRTNLEGLAPSFSTHDADPGIHAPAEDEVVFENTLELSATDTEASDNDVQWAVRLGTCARSTNTVAGNVDGFDDPSEFEDGSFSAELDISVFEAGQYCFIFNTTRGEAEGSRLTREFYIVDEYMKIGGTIGLDHDEFDVPGGPFSHSLEGVVGNAGAEGTVGSITVNYRWHGEHCTFRAGEGSSLSFTNAGGIGVESELRGDFRNAEGECDGGATASSAHIIGLDRDADAETDEDFPRGAVIVRWEGGVSESDYEIDGTPGDTGADSWVPMEGGNNHVGTR